MMNKDLEERLSQEGKARENARTGMPTDFKDFGDVGLITYGFKNMMASYKGAEEKINALSNDEILEIQKRIDKIKKDTSDAPSHRNSGEVRKFLIERLGYEYKEVFANGAWVRIR